MKTIIRAHVALALSGLLVTPVYARTYTVKAGDTLSGITHREVGGPVWGPGGTLSKVKSLNPQIKNPDRIYPNDVVVLSEEETPAASAEVPASEPVEQEQAATDASAPTTAADAGAEATPQAGSARHRLRLLGVMSNTGVKAEAKGLFKTNLDSDINTGGELSYAYFLSDATVAGFTVGILQSQFGSSKDGRFKGIIKNLKGFSLDVDHRLSDSFRLGGFLGVQQFYFVTENNATSLTLEPVFVDNVGVVFAYDAIRSAAFDAGLDVRGTYASPAKGSAFDVKTGYTYGGSIFALLRLNETFGILGNLFYERRIQDTSGTSQRNVDQGIKLGGQAEF